MNNEQMLKELGTDLNTSNGNVYCNDSYVHYIKGSSVVNLDGGFDLTYLEALVAYMRSTQA